MESNTEKSHDRIAKRKSRWPGSTRALALVLTLMILLTSSGMQIRSADAQAGTAVTEEAADADTGDPEPAAEEVTTDPEPSAPETEPDTTDTIVETPADIDDTPPAEEAAPETEAAEAQAADAAEEAPLEDEAEPALTQDGVVHDGEMDITQYLKPWDAETKTGTYIKVTATDGKMYTMDDLNAKGLTVAQGAKVEVHLVWTSFQIEESIRTLTYTIPEGVLSNIRARSGWLTDELQYSIDEDGHLELTIDDSFYDDPGNIHDGKIWVQELNVTINATLDSSRGQTSGNDDNVISFTGNGDIEGSDVEFTIPFEYPNENGKVTVDKSSTFDQGNNVINYTIVVTAPAENTLTAKSVYVEDTFDDSSKIYLNQISSSYYYNVVASKGTFDKTEGVWLIGDMAAGTTETLTYSVSVTSVFKTTTGAKIGNEVIAHFNSNGTAGDHNVVDCSNTLKIAKSNNNAQLQTDATGTYITYTITVTAPSTNEDTMTDITVEDNFTTSNAISSVVVDDSSKDVQISGSSFVWNVGSMAPGTTQTLTYKAYIKPSFWANIKGAGQSTTANIQNAATVSSGGSAYDKVTNTTKVSKVWVSKSSVIDDSTKDITFTVRVNEPSGGGALGTVTKITDSMTGNYTYGSTLSVTRYSASGAKVDTTTIQMSDVKTTTDDGVGWTLDMSAGSTYAYLAGTYTYEVVYTATTSASVSTISNQAGVGASIGGTDLTSSVNWTYSSVNMSGKKAIVTIDDGNINGLAIVDWKITLPFAVPAGMTLYDELQQQNNSWFTKEYIEGIQVFVDYNNNGEYNAGTDTLLTEGEDGDYQIVSIRVPITDPTKPSGTVSASTIIAEAPLTEDSYATYVREDTTKLLIAYAYTLKFNNDVAITNNGKTGTVVVRYKSVYDQNKAGSGTYVDKNKDFAQSIKNSAILSYPGLNNVSLDYDTSLQRIVSRVAMTKTAGNLQSDGSIVWSFEVNRSGTLEGEAIIEDVLPEQLTFPTDLTTEELIAQGWIKATNAYGKIDKVEVADGKIKIYLSGLQNDNGPYYASYKGQNSRVTFTFQLKTRVKDSVLMTSVSGGVAITNKANLYYNDELYYLTTGSKTIYVQGIQKAATVESNGELDFTMTINPYGIDLIEDDEVATVTVVDTMGTGMHLDVNRTNGYFFVYDITGGGSTLLTEGVDYTLDDETQTGDENLFKVTVPDNKPIKIVYYVVLDGAEGDTVSYSNTAHFEFEGYVSSSTAQAKPTNGSVELASYGGSLYTHPWFYLYKQDQWKLPVAGAEFTLYEVTLGANNAISLTYVDTKKTDVNGKIEFAEDTLDKDTLYCVIETSAPEGYVYDSAKRIYVEFSHHTDIESVIKNGTDQNYEYHTIRSGISLYEENTLETASFAVPVTKKINGKTLDSKMEFSFRLVTADSKKVYTDETCEEPFKGLDVTITGSGTTTFETLYFKASGTYTFYLTENDLVGEYASLYTKDTSQYLVTVEVLKNADNSLSIGSVKYEKVTAGGNVAADAPVFDNIYYTDATVDVTLTGTKELTGNRTNHIDQDEFKFIVSEKVNGEKQEITTGTTVGETSDETTNTGEADDTLTHRSAILFDTITYDFDDIGTHRYTVTEVAGGDTSINYTTSISLVFVEVYDNGDGTLGAEVSYMSSSADENGVVFTNDYKAEGTLTLTASKKVENRTQKVKAGEFTFQVREDGKLVSTASTQTGGAIEFEPFVYDQNDIGLTHTYEITEVEGKNYLMTYSEQVYTVVVTVSDSETSDGTLAISAKYYDSDGQEITADDIQFVNTFNYTPKSGIILDVLPYVLIAGGAAVLLAGWEISRRKKQRG